MGAQQGKARSQKHLLDALALEAKLPADEVARIYEEEHAELAADARVASYLPIFAIRNVRARLHRRSAVKTPPGSTGGAARG
jgi:hypothetical protein